MGVFHEPDQVIYPIKTKEVLDSVMNQLYNAIRVMVEGILSLIS